MKIFVRGAVAAMALSLMGVSSASAQYDFAGNGWTSWGLFNDCGGNAFEVCFSANVYTMGSAIGVNVTNVGPNGTITRIGVVNVEDPTTVTYGTPNAGPNGAWNWESNSGLGGAGLPPTIWAYQAPPSPMKNGLEMGETGAFSFVFDPDFDLAKVGIAVHAQGYLGCSSKYGFWDVGRVVDGNLTGYATNDRGPDYDGSCARVPEPSSAGLIALGMLGMVFLVRRREEEILG